MAKWEYAKISLTGLSGAILTYPDGSELVYRDLPETARRRDPMLSLLNHAAPDGWELVTSAQAAGINAQYATLWLRREKS
jgi:hypothetical protein